MLARHISPKAMPEINKSSRSKSMARWWMFGGVLCVLSLRIVATKRGANLSGERVGRAKIVATQAILIASGRIID